MKVGTTADSVQSQVGGRWRRVANTGCNVLQRYYPQGLALVLSGWQPERSRELERELRQLITAALNVLAQEHQNARKLERQERRQLNKVLDSERAERRAENIWVRCARKRVARLVRETGLFG